MTPADEKLAPPTNAIAPPERRGRFRRLPRFGLRTLFVLGVLFCLLFGWIGRNAVRMRREEAAFEAFQQVRGRFYVHGGDESSTHWPRDSVGYPDAAGRLLGWKRPPRVRQVYLNSDHPQDDRIFARVVDALATFPEIERVDLLGRDVTDESLVVLTRLPKLESIHLGNTSVTSAGIERLGLPLRIRELTLSQPDPDEGVALDRLIALKELRSSSVTAGSMSREDVVALASLPELEELRLRLVRPEEEDVYAALEGAKQLRFLQLYAAGCDDADMATIAKLPALKELYVEGITDAGLAPLDSAIALRLIALYEPVSHLAAVEHSAKHPDRVVCYFNELARAWIYFRGGKSIQAGDLPEEMRERFRFQ